MIIAFALAVILAFVHLFSEKYVSHVEKFHVHTLSFSAGLFLGLIFLDLLPEVFKGTYYLGESVYLFMVFGFTLFHIGEKYVYQHVKNKSELLKDLSLIHIFGFFVNHFLIGILVFIVFSYERFVSGFFVFIPLLLHSFSSSISLEHIGKHFNKKILTNFFLPISPVLGVAFAALFHTNLAFYYTIFPFVVGAMLYIVIRDTIPRGEAGKPAFFLIGVLLSVLANIVITIL